MHKLITKYAEPGPRRSESLIRAGPCSQPGDYKGVTSLQPASQPASQQLNTEHSHPEQMPPKKIIPTHAHPLTRNYYWGGLPCNDFLAACAGTKLNRTTNFTWP